jgi:hypothetical protein
MNKSIKSLVILGSVGLLAIFLIGGFFGYRTDCIRAENKLDAQYSQDKNNYDNMRKKFMETAQVNQKYSDDMKEIWSNAMSGRYGADGSKALFQFVKEHNPTLDSSIYTKLMSIIEAGRNSFEADQKQLLDIKNMYKDLLGSTRGLLYNWALGFPRCDLSKYDIVTSSSTEEAFKTKQADEIDVFGKKK